MDLKKDLHTQETSRWSSIRYQNQFLFLMTLVLTLVMTWVKC